MDDPAAGSVNPWAVGIASKDVQHQQPPDAANGPRVAAVALRLPLRSAARHLFYLRGICWDAGFNPVSVEWQDSKTRTSVGPFCCHGELTRLVSLER